MKSVAGVAGVAAALLLACGAAGCHQKKAPPSVAGRSALADSADQIMFGVRLRLTEGGVDRALLSSDTAFFFNDNTRIELERVRTEFHTTTGVRNAVLTSQRGTYLTSGAMTARGDAVIVTDDGRRLQSEEIKYDRNTNLVSSDSAFVLTEPERRLQGVGFRSDPDLRNIQVLRVISATGSVDLSKAQR